MRLFSCLNIKKILFEHSVQTLCSKSMYTKFGHTFEHFLESVRTLFQKCSNTKTKVFEHFLKSVRTLKQKCLNTKKKVFEHKKKVFEHFKKSVRTCLVKLQKVLKSA